MAGRDISVNFSLVAVTITVGAVARIDACALPGFGRLLGG
jgi:hypothetical protein